MVHQFCVKAAGHQGTALVGFNCHTVECKGHLLLSISCPLTPEKLHNKMSVWFNVENNLLVTEYIIS